MGVITITVDNENVLLEIKNVKNEQMGSAIVGLMSAVIRMSDIEMDEDGIIGTYGFFCDAHLQALSENEIMQDEITKEEMMIAKEKMNGKSFTKEF